MFFFPVRATNAAQSTFVSWQRDPHGSATSRTSTMVVTVAPENVLKKPIKSKGGMVMGSLDATYLKRRQECSDKFFTCKSGRTYCYFTDGSDPAQEGVAVVLCIHGQAQRSTDWLLKEPLPDIFQICVDRIGHGLSSNAPAEGFAFADGCDELLEVVDAVYAEVQIPVQKKFFVTGHSMGGTWSIEMAACPTTRDRIEAIAPVASPLDFNNPRITEAERKGKLFKDLGVSTMIKAGKPSCGGALAKKMLMYFAPVRPSVKKSGDKKYGQDYGMADNFKQMTTYDDIAGDTKWRGAMDADPFFITKMMDGSKSCNTPHDFFCDTARCWHKRWSYDPSEVKVPCFLYCGSLDSISEDMTKLNQRLIGDSAEVIVWEGAGHLSVGIGYASIVQALVKKEKAASPV